MACVPDCALRLGLADILRCCPDRQDSGGVCGWVSGLNKGLCTTLRAQPVLSTSWAAT